MIPLRHKTVTAGMIWVCAVQFFIVQIIVQSAWTTPFSLSTNYISDLGNTVCRSYPEGSGTYVCSPWHALMNLSFSLQGGIVMAGTFLLMPSLPSGRTKMLILTLLVLTGLGMMGVGIFPENLNNQAHVYSAGLQFVTCHLAMVIAGITRLLPTTKRTYHAASIIFGCVGLAATCLFPIGIHLGLGTGGMERVAAYTFPIWLAWTGLLLVKAGREAHPQIPI